MERKPLEKTIQITIEKPTTTLWPDTLTYLARVIDPKDIPNYTILMGLASYARSNGGLTTKQSKIAQEIINYAKNRGLL